MNSFQRRQQHFEFINPNLNPNLKSISTQNQMSTWSEPTNSNNNSKSDDEETGVLIRLSTVTSKNELFFLDFPLFVMSIENISTVLGTTRPGPLAEVDLYRLYCTHMQGDKHILRTIQSICKYCHKPEVEEMMSVAVKLAPTHKLKAQRKLEQFYQLHGLMDDILSQPFICSEGLVRLTLINIWKNEGKGKVTRKKMCKLYILYCRHISSLKEFFSNLFELSCIIPGPYKIEHLENLLIMVKNVTTERFLSKADVFNLAHYIREFVGIDHDIFLRLPSVVRVVVTSQPVELLIVPEQFELTHGDETKEYLELCTLCPSSVQKFDRVQLQFPSELTNPSYVKIFSWIFHPSRDEVGIFYISNCQWNEFLVLDDHNTPGLYRVSTTKDYNNDKCKFTLVLKDESVQIVSQFTHSPILVNDRAQVVYVEKEKRQMEDGTFFSVKLTSSS